MVKSIVVLLYLSLKNNGGGGLNGSATKCSGTNNQPENYIKFLHGRREFAYFLSCFNDGIY